MFKDYSIDVFQMCLWASILLKYCNQVLQRSLDLLTEMVCNKMVCNKMVVKIKATLETQHRGGNTISHSVQS